MILLKYKKVNIKKIKKIIIIPNIMLIFLLQVYFGINDLIVM